MEEEKKEAPILLNQLEGRPERVLIIKDYNSKFEGWHPTLGEFDLIDPSSNPAGGYKGDYHAKKVQEEAKEIT